MLVESCSYADAGGAGQVARQAVERRAYQRFKVGLTGVCSVAAGPDIACHAIDLSIGGLAVASEAETCVGVDAAILLPQVGMVRGKIVRVFDGGFAIAFVEGRPQRERVANFLVWLIERETNPESEDDRRHARIVPLRRVVSIVVAGTSTMARIIDISRSGVAVTTTVCSVVVGDIVRLGTTPAVIARLFQGGFAAQFVEPFGADFDASIVL